MKRKSDDSLSYQLSSSQILSQTLLQDQQAFQLNINKKFKDIQEGQQTILPSCGLSQHTAKWKCLNKQCGNRNFIFCDESTCREKYKKCDHDNCKWFDLEPIVKSMKQIKATQQVFQSKINTISSTFFTKIGQLIGQTQSVIKEIANIFDSFFAKFRHFKNQITFSDPIQVQTLTQAYENFDKTFGINDLASSHLGQKIFLYQIEKCTQKITAQIQDIRAFSSPIKKYQEVLSHFKNFNIYDQSERLNDIQQLEKSDSQNMIHNPQVSASEMINSLQIERLNFTNQEKKHLTRIQKEKNASEELEQTTANTQSDRNIIQRKEPQRVYFDSENLEKDQRQVEIWEMETVSEVLQRQKQFYESYLQTFLMSQRSNFLKAYIDVKKYQDSLPQKQRPIQIYQMIILQDKHLLVRNLVESKNKIDVFIRTTSNEEYRMTLSAILAKKSSGNIKYHELQSFVSSKSPSQTLNWPASSGLEVRINYIQKSTLPDVVIKIYDAGEQYDRPDSLRCIILLSTNSMGSVKLGLVNKKKEVSDPLPSREFLGKIYELDDTILSEHQIKSMDRFVEISTIREFELYERRYEKQKASYRSTRPRQIMFD